MEPPGPPPLMEYEARSHKHEMVLPSAEWETRVAVSNVVPWFEKFYIAQWTHRPHSNGYSKMKINIIFAFTLCVLLFLKMPIKLRGHKHLLGYLALLT